MTANAIKLLCIDCDSTLSSIEGVDELARLRGPAAFAQVEGMTRAAMEGAIPLEQVFARRMEIIRPSRAEVEAVGRLYVSTVEPTARATLDTLRAAGWTPVIVSAGFTQAILPLAEHLGIARIEAVRLDFGAEGGYAGYDRTHPATRRGGKPDIVRALRAELHPVRTAAVGDGVSDLEIKPEVDLFVGFGRYAERALVRDNAHRFIRQLSELPAILA